MGMNSKDGLSYSDTSQSRKEARRARADAVRHFDQKETTRHREAIANCRGEARQARAQRKAQRIEAKERCEGYVREAKEKGKDKPPYRRRADLANARKACALDLAHVEEQAAQVLEAADQKCNEEKARRRSSRTSAKHERSRAKERERTTARERLDEMFEQIRNDLEPGLLPYFEEIKGSAALKKLLNGGRMTPTEAVLHMAHEDPEAVFAALERQAEKELQELLREQERWEYEGGRVGEDASEDTSTHVLSDPGTTTEKVAPVESKRRRASRGKRAKAHDAEGTAHEAQVHDAKGISRDAPAGDPKGIGRDAPASDTNGTARERKPSGAKASGAKASRAKASNTSDREPRAPRSKGEQGPSRGSTPRETRSERKTVHEGDSRSAGIHPDGEGWIATTWAESHRFNVHADAVEWLRDRGFHADGSPIGPATASAPSEVVARAEEANEREGARQREAMGPVDIARPEVVARAEATNERGATTRREATTQREATTRPEATTQREVTARAEATARQNEAGAREERPSCGGRCQRSGSDDERAIVSPPGKQRLSAEERTGWLPGTEPGRVPPLEPEPEPRGRTTLFEEEPDTEPETPEAKRRQIEQGGRREHGTQQVFGTTFTSWLNQAGPQLTLEQAPRDVHIGGRSVHMAHALLAPRGVHTSAPNVHTTHAQPAARGVHIESTDVHTSSSDRESSAPPNARGRIATAEATRDITQEGTRDSTQKATRDSTPAHGEPIDMVRRYADATLYMNRPLQRIQVRFDTMPPARFRMALREAGYRWLAALERWQAPLDDARLRVAERALTEYAAEVEARIARRAHRGAPGARAVSTPATRAAEIEPAAQAASPGIHNEVDRGDTGAGEFAEEGAEDDDFGDDDAEDENIAENGGEGETRRPRSLYERKRAGRISRMRARAAQLAQASSSIYESARARADRIPLGQPILVGHHSEGRDRRYRTKINADFRKAAELEKEADDLRRRANAAESGRAISSDDPDAIAKLSAKVNERGDFIARARRINDVLHAARTGRKTGWEPLAVQRLVAIGIDRETAERLTRKNALGRFGIPGSEVRNAQAEIARLNRRIDDLQQRDARPTRPPERMGEAVIVENRDTNRVEIRLDGVPPKELREQLRGRGFVWAPSVGAWQRKLNENALWAARHVLRSFYEEGRAAKSTSTQGSAEARPAHSPEVAERAVMEREMVEREVAEREPGLDEEPYSASTIPNAGGPQDVAPF